MLEIGLTYTSTTEVTNDKLAVHLGSGDLPVWGTPAMMALMENAAMMAVANHLPEGSTTVGTAITSTHLRPTLCGDNVYAKAILTAIDNRKLDFDISAFNEKEELIGEGKHTRFIVDKERFMQKCRQ